ncbi:MAG TPA: hypothetical protein VNM34_09400 [Verrucomicrobiae bacterium]|nr:hypothetical protein [Verrucomicrobiae bacterium]
MTTFTSLLVSAHQDALLAEAAAERLARSATNKPARPNRIAAAAKSVWSLLAVSADRPATAPKLTDYPFRS